MVLQATQRWVCPNCPATEVTQGQANRFHTCRGLRGLHAPMVLEGTRCKVIAVEREEYVGREDVQTDADGRPVMAVLTVREDGQDCVVYAPTAHLRSDL